MKLKQNIYIVFVGCTTFVVYQLYLLYRFSPETTVIDFDTLNGDFKLDGHVNTKKKMIMKENLPEVSFIDELATAQSNIELLISLLKDRMNRLFLLDVPLLRKIMRLTQQQQQRVAGNCSFLCSKARKVDFGIFAADLDQLNFFARCSRHFEISVIREVSQETQRETNRTSAVQLFRKGHVVNVRVYRAVRAQYLWASGNMLDTAKAMPTLELEEVLLDGLALVLPKYPSLVTDERHDFVPCNQTRANLFAARHPPTASESDRRFVRDAERTLRGAARILDRLEIPFWLSSGTCLGWYRQCAIIPHGRDVDIGVYIEHFQPRLISAFQAENFVLLHQFGKPEDSLELSFSHDGTKLDIFFFYRERNFTWNGGTQLRTNKKFKYVFPPFRMCWTAFLRTFVRVPCPTESYVSANYGPHWFTPVKRWDWKSSPFNVKTNGQWA